MKRETSVIPPILTIPEELFIPITSFMDTKSHLALARTCKTLYSYYNGCYKEQPFTFLCDTKCFEDETSYYIKVIKSYISYIAGWGNVKFTLKTVSTNLQNSYEHPIKALYLNVDFELPNGLDYPNLNVLILEFSDETKWLKPNLSLGKFSNLKLLSFNGAILNGDIMSILAEIPLLKFLYVKFCGIRNSSSQKTIFEDCTTLEEIQLHHCELYDRPSIKLPPQLKKFTMKEFDDEFEQIDASLCTQLECL